MKILEIKNFDLAYKVSQLKPELSNTDIKEIFGISTGTLYKFKKMIHEEMAKRDCPAIDPRRVNTAIAFESCGYPIDELEKKYLKLKKAGLL